MVKFEIDGAVLTCETKPRYRYENVTRISYQAAW